MNVPKLRFANFKIDWEENIISQLVQSMDAGVSVNSEDRKPIDEEYSVLKTSCVTHGVFSGTERKAVTEEIEVSRLKEPLLDNSIVISRMNTPLLVGANAYIEFAPAKTFLPDRLWQIKVYKNVVDMRWLSLWLSNERNLEKVRSFATGTSDSMKNITKSDVMGINISVPDIQEQSKIATFLTAMDEKIAQLTQKHTLLTQYKKGVMQQIFSQELRFKNEDGLEFADWESKSLGEIASFIKDGTHGTHQDSEDGEYYLLSAKNVLNGKINYDDSDRRISKNEFDSIYKNYNLKEGDVLLSVVGTIGRVAIYSSEFHKVAFQRSVAFFRFYNQSSQFIAQLFTSTEFQNLLLVNQVVSAQPGIYLGDLAKIIVNIPSLAEQTKIATFLTAIDDKLTHTKAQLNAVKQYKQALLQQMFV